MRDAARNPEDWDTAGLLSDAADSVDSLTQFLRRFLNPEDMGRAVPAHVRDEVRFMLGQDRCEQIAEEVPWQYTQRLGDGGE